jgi:hypothetical protein
MAETDAPLLILVGKLSQDMEEGIRQRSRQFHMIETISHQLAELQANFHSHAAHEEEQREAIATHLSTLATTQAAMGERVAVVEARPAATACDTDKPAEPGSSRTRLVGGLGGVGLLTLVFGDDVVGGLQKVGEAIRRALH